MGASSGWACAHLGNNWVGIAHPDPEFPSLERVWVTTAHPGFCAKTVLYYNK